MKASPLEVRPTALSNRRCSAPHKNRGKQICVDHALVHHQSGINGCTRSFQGQPKSKQFRRGRIQVVSSASEATEARKNPDLYDSIASAEGAAAAQATRLETAATLPQPKPEVLAPAGGWPQLKAAVECGADAVYFGLTDFNARARANNFHPTEDLPEVMKYLHSRGVKGYVTMNILVFDDELERAAEMVRQVAAAGVDAVIVQDWAVVRLIRQVAPEVAVHGSTQMTITSAEGVHFAAARGVDRVVLGRELSVKEIRQVSAAAGVEVECFVHGALCVSYSGQCFSSEAWGGRSANRGQCAQACRMPYGLVDNGALKDLQDLKYLLSPQDLMAVDQVPDLVAAGVSCFKIEGRLKSADYVAITTLTYRRAIDALYHPEASPVGEAAGRQWEEDLQQVFARGQDGEHGGLTAGFLEGPRHQDLVRGRCPRHRGLHLGRVSDHTPRGILVQLSGPVKRGDGVVFDCGRPEEEEAGGAVYEVCDFHGRRIEANHPVREGEVELVFRRGAVDTAAVPVGAHVWRTKDPTLEARLRKVAQEAIRNQPPPATSAAAANLDRTGVVASVAGEEGAPLLLTLEDVNGHRVQVNSDMPLQRAEGRALGEGALRRSLGDHLGARGELRLALVDASRLPAAPGVFLPPKEIKRMRREAVELLKSKRCGQQAEPSEEAAAGGPVVPGLLAEVLPEEGPRGAAEEEEEGAGLAAAGEAQFSVLCRTREQADAAAGAAGVEEVALDFLEVQGLVEAVEAVRAAGKRVVVATPRVLKPQEERLWKFYLNLRADSLLIRSTGLLHHLLELGGPGAEVEAGRGAVRIPQLRGDFSLNAANAITALEFLNLGLERLCLTHDLNAHQMAHLARTLQALGEAGSGAAARVEAVVHQHLPIFHTEHCVFCRFLSDGQSYKDCGHPCEDHSVHLRDHEGADHLVLADMGCRNTVFNAKAQSGVRYMAGLMRSGVRHFRVELVDEPADVVQPLLDTYAQAARGEMTYKEAWAWLATLPDANGRAHGVTEGSLQPTKERHHSTMKRVGAAS